MFLGTGAASYMNVAEIEALGVKVHTIKGYGDTAVAEQTIALMMAACRDLARMDRDIRAGTWQPLEGVQLFGKTLGIIGLGGIGARGGAHRQGHGHGGDRLEPHAARRTRPCRWSSSTTLLQRADVVSLNLTLNDETRGFLDSARIARMKPGAILVNTARGALVDEAALIEALQSGHIRHAGLDVFHNEPLKADHPLARMDNVTLSAHAAFRTLEASMTLLRRAIDIVKRVQAEVSSAVAAALTVARPCSRHNTPDNKSPGGAREAGAICLCQGEIARSCHRAAGAPTARRGCSPAARA